MYMYMYLSVQLLWVILQICLLSLPCLSQYILISPTSFILCLSYLLFASHSHPLFHSVPAYTWFEGTKVRFSTTGTQHQSLSLFFHSSKQLLGDISNCQWTFPFNNLLAGLRNFHIIYPHSSKYTDDFSHLGSKSAFHPHSPRPFFSLQLSKMLLFIRIFNPTVFCLALKNSLFLFFQCALIKIISESSLHFW